MITHIDSVDNYILPIPEVGNHKTFPEFISLISSSAEQSIRNYIRDLLQQADIQFRNSNTRKQDYYVKETRSRTIITIYGQIPLITSFLRFLPIHLTLTQNCFT